MADGILLATDGRGKHNNRPHSVPDEAKCKMRERVMQFPRRKSHYSRTDNQKCEYLNEGLSISRMYNMYAKNMSLM